MHLALAWLREDEASVGDLARLGYESKAAFSRAFKRYMGLSPGAARNRRALSGERELELPGRDAEARPASG